MIEELLHPNRKVATVFFLDDAMRLVVVVEKPAGTLQPAEGHKELNALIPRNSAVLIVMEDQQGRLDAIGKKERGVLNEGLTSFPEILPDAALRALVLKHPA